MSTESNRKIDDIASHWIARCDAYDWSETDAAELNRWLDESDRHQIAYLRLQRIWDESRRLRALGAGVPPGHVPEPGQWMLTPFFDRAARTETDGAREPRDAFDAAIPAQLQVSSVRRRAPWAIAAAVVLAATLYVFSGERLQRNSFSTPTGGVTLLPLDDGSKITLNTASKVRVDLTATERRVELEEGEVFFDVAKDPKRPFVVTAGDKRIVVLGTRFSVRRDAEDIRVAVTEGAVQVETPNTTRAPERLEAGAVAHTGRAGTLVQRKPLREVEEELSWRGGMLVFRDKTLADAIAEFNRYTERKIVIEDPRIAGLRVAGSFQSSNADDFVRLLEQGYPLRVESKDDRIVLLAR